MDRKITAESLRKKGRHGDTILAHITPSEAKILESLGGSGSINPETGLPEYGFFSDLWDNVTSIAPLVISFAFPALAPEIGLALGASEAFAPLVGSAVIGGGMAALQGGDIASILKSAGTSALSSYLSPILSSTFGSEIPASALISGAKTALQGGNIADILKSAGTGALSSAASSFFAPSVGAGDTYIGDPAAIAAANPDLYPGGVLPLAGQTTTFSPEDQKKITNTLSKLNDFQSSYNDNLKIYNDQLRIYNRNVEDYNNYPNVKNWMEDFYAGKFKGETPLATRNSLAIAANQAADNLNDAYNKALDSYTSYYETLQESPETQNYLEEYKKYEDKINSPEYIKPAQFGGSRAFGGGSFDLPRQLFYPWMVSGPITPEMAHFFGQPVTPQILNLIQNANSAPTYSAPIVNQPIATAVQQSIQAGALPTQQVTDIPASQGALASVSADVAPVTEASAPISQVAESVPPVAPAPEAAPVTPFAPTLDVAPPTDVVPPQPAGGLPQTDSATAQSAAAPSIIDQIINNLPSVSTMAQNAAINAITQLATTGNVDPAKVLTSVATGAVGTAVGATVGQGVLSATDSALAASVASGAAKGALQAVITGADPLQSALASGAASGLGSVAKDAGISIPQPVINAVVNSVASGAPLSQTLTGAALTVASGLAKDAILGAQAPAPVETGVPSISDQSAVQVSAAPQAEQPVGVALEPIDQQIGQYEAPLLQQVAGTTETDTYGALPYQNVYTGSYASDTGQVPQVIGDYVQPSDTTVAQQMPEVTVTASPEESVVNDTSAATIPTYTPNVTAPTVVTTTVPVSGGSAASTAASTGTAASNAATTPKASDISTYIPPIPGYLRPTELSTGAVSQVSPLWAGIDPRLAQILTQRVAHGGQIHPRLIKVLHERGGELVPGPENRLYMRHAKRGFAVEGPGTGQSDDIPTMLSQDEYVIDADTVAALGDGSSKAGAEALDKMREEIRRHKRSAPVDKIPPKAKSPLEYLKMAKRK